tara:strand:- start:118 stop:477 length:360 start_codon:yes stop_codon:yes gene_type:complete
MIKQGKVWGNTQSILSKNNVEMHRIKIDAGGYCSKHKHEHKYNAFFIEKGRLKITIWKNDYDLIDETILSDQELSIVNPQEYHMFEAIEDTIAYEIYWTEISPSDIIRENHGGQREQNN